MTRRSLFLFLTIALFPLRLAATPDVAPLKAVGTITFSKGYIDDRFALNPQGTFLAYVTIEAKGSAEVRIRNLATAKERSFVLTKTTNEPQEIAFVPGHQILYVVTGSGQYKSYHFFDFAGKKLGTLNGVTDLLATTASVTTYRRYSGNGIQVHTVTLYKLPNLTSPEKTMRLKGDVRGYMDVEKDKFAISYFTPDYTKAVGKIIGKYDKKSDSKLPDTLGTFDLAARKLSKGRTIANSSVWDKEAYRFYRHPGYTNILDLHGTPTVQGIKGRFRISQAPHKWGKVSCGFQLGRFEFSTLHQERRRDALGKIWFSMMVDPQNPITLKSLKSEKRYIHFFSIDPKTAQAADHGKVPAYKGIVVWKKGGNYIAVMRLSKFWTVGSETLEIYRVK